MLRVEGIWLPAPLSRACFDNSITWDADIVPVPTIIGIEPLTVFTAVCITFVLSSLFIVDASPVVPKITTPSVPTKANGDIALQAD